MFQYSSKTIFSRWPLSVKAAIAFSLMALSFFFRQPAEQAVLFFLVAALLAIAGFKDFAKIFASILPFLVLSDFAIIFLFPAMPNLAPMLLAANLRVIVLLFSFAFLSFTTDAFAIAKAMRKARLPEAISLSFYIVLRFLPEIEADLGEIISLNKLKGISPKRPFIFLKATFVPLLLILFQRTDELTIAYYLRKKREKFL